MYWPLNNRADSWQRPEYRGWWCWGQSFLREWRGSSTGRGHPLQKTRDKRWKIKESIFFCRLYLMTLEITNVIFIRKLTVTLDCTMSSVFFCNVNSISTSAQVVTLLKTCKLVIHTVQRAFCTLHIMTLLYIECKKLLFTTRLSGQIFIGTRHVKDNLAQGWGVAPGLVVVQILNRCIRMIGAPSWSYPSGSPEIDKCVKRSSLLANSISGLLHCDTVR